MRPRQSQFNYPKMDTRGDDSANKYGARPKQYNYNPGEKRYPRWYQGDTTTRRYNPKPGNENPSPQFNQRSQYYTGKDRETPLHFPKEPTQTEHQGSLPLQTQATGFAMGRSKEVVKPPQDIKKVQIAELPQYANPPHWQTYFEPIGKECYANHTTCCSGTLPFIPIHIVYPQGGTLANTQILALFDSASSKCLAKLSFLKKFYPDTQLSKTNSILQLAAPSMIVNVPYKTSLTLLFESDSNRVLISLEFLVLNELTHDITLGVPFLLDKNFHLFSKNEVILTTETFPLNQKKPAFQNPNPSPS